LTEPAANADLAARPFDELLAELQRIVQALEAGNLPLEESIARYREALRLHAAAELRLRDRASAAMISGLADRGAFLGQEGRALARLLPDTAAARQRTAELVDRGHRALSARTSREAAALSGIADSLRALSPTATLERGYAVARLPDGTIVRDPAEATPGEPLEVVVARGTIATRVETTAGSDEEVLR
jgi:exodeoxyribonuclease VII small subunit